MTTNPYANGNGHLYEADNHNGFTHQLEEPVQIKGFSVTYDRKFNLGNFESLNPAITIWVKTRVPESTTFDLHGCKERVRRLARENVRAQLQRLQGNEEVVFLGLQPPGHGGEDPVFIRTISVSLFYKVNLGNFQSIMPGYTDWADVRHISHSPGELHMALTRMWESVWANTLDEISRAQGHGQTNAFFGLPTIEVEDLTAESQPNGRVVAPMGASNNATEHGTNLPGTAG
jgi:hypothetical protein